MNDAIDFIDCVILISPHLRYQTIKKLQAFQFCHSCLLLIKEFICTLRYCSGIINITGKSMNLSQTLTNDLSTLCFKKPSVALTNYIHQSIQFRDSLINAALSSFHYGNLTNLIQSLICLLFFLKIREVVS